MEPQIVFVPTDDEYQKLEVSFIRKRDGQIVNIKLQEIFRQLLSADFTNNEITLNGEICHLNSFRKKTETFTVSVGIALNGFTGKYEYNGDTFRVDHVFTEAANTIKTIRITPDDGFEIESIKDQNSVLYNPDPEGFINVSITADISLTITFKSKVI